MTSYEPGVEIYSTGAAERMCAKNRARPASNQEILADAILDELQEQVRRSGQSISALSEAIGRNRGWLGNHLRCRTVPNMVDLIMIADKAGFDVKKLIPKLQEHEDAADNFVVDGVRDLLTRRSFKRPDPHDVFRWHLENGGQLRNHEWFEDYYELFEMPDVQNIKVRPIYMGRLSIAATVLNLESVNGLLTFFDRLKDKELREIVAEHAQVLKTQKSSIATRTAHYHITAGHEATMEYIRILLPVREGKKDLVMNYSVTTELRETFKRTTDMEVLDISSLKFSIA